MLSGMEAARYDAPGRLEMVRQFVNSRDVETATDAIADPSGLAEWLTAQKLLEPGARVGDADVANARVLREALRAALLANHDQQPPPQGARQELNAAARRAALTPVLQPTGEWQAQPDARGTDAALGAIVATVAQAMGGAEWPRL